ncbi:MAG: exodeoxyribonuclease VII small subunit [Verrucomicrobiae bacterium]|nr:exodeoxyribonuclease VII small subunit [Verrucomicrobiae bacterium]
MPKSEKAQAPTPPEGAKAGPTFEEAYGQLEELVREMESDEMSLADLIEAYEQGIKLHALCQQRLEEAQGRIEMIRRRANGETELEPFDEASASKAGSDSSASTSGSSSPSLRSDVELF